MRTKHNALLDCELLAKVYIKLTDQKEPTLDFHKSNEQNNNENLNSKVSYFKKVIKANKKFIQAYYGLYTLDNNLLGDEDYNYLESLLENGNLNLNNNGLINFLLSKREKDKKRKEK